MVMNGKLDFQTVFSGAKEQYEKMEGSAKLLVEFPYAGHCPGLSEACGTTIIASFLRNGGSVNATNTSCAATLPGPVFDVDAYIKARVAAADTNATASGPNVTHIRSAALSSISSVAGIAAGLLAAIATMLAL
ncbi:hypothetical protein PINS_up011575 [Pythium insidiosum]|nr:hypothetical protein PINS_up011575 [Pythium insidiosum]